MSIPSISNGNGKGVSSGQRLNKKPAIIVAGIVLATLFGVYYAAMQRTAPQRLALEEGGEEMLSIDATPELSIEFLKDRPDGLAGIDRSLFDAPNANGKKKERISNIDDQMMDAYEAEQLRKMQQDNAMRQQMVSRQIEQARSAIEGGIEVKGFGRGSEFQQERIETERKQVAEIPAAAYGQPIDIQNIAPAQTPPATQSNNSFDAIAAQLPAQYRDAFKQIMAAQGGVPPEPNAQSVDSSTRYLNAATQGRDFTLRNKVESPRTRFEIKTGTILPAAMISAANSDLPGDIVAQITQNVYDSQTGKFLLIPQGTKMFGRYDAYTALGQERLLIVWDRLIFPDAETLDIGGMQGYDGRGLAGVKDRVMTHFFRTLFNAFLISTVDAAGKSLATEAAQNIDNSFVLNLASGFGETASKPFDEYLRNRLRIKPTLEIRAGFRFNVMVSKDISLDAPYRYGYKLTLAE